MIAPFCAAIGMAERRNGGSVQWVKEEEHPEATMEEND